MLKTSYSQFSDRIDVDAWEDSIGFVKKSGKHDEDIGYCLDPWGQHNHGDTTGKLAINREKRLYNCWVCGGGTLLQYTMALKDMSEDKATEWLYQFTRAIDETKEQFEQEVDKLLFETQDEIKTPPYFNKKVLEKWIGSWSPEMLSWMASRGISEETIQTYGVGYNPELSMRGHTAPAVVFPHFWQDRLVGWQSRWLGDFPKSIPKYVFTNDFPRDVSIYGFEHIKESLSPVIICESVPTVLFLASEGIPAVATFGSSVTNDQLRWLRGLQQGVIIAADNDKAGDKFERLLVEGLERYITVKTIERVPGSGGDLGDLVNEPEILQYLISNATIPGL